MILAKYAAGAARGRRIRSGYLGALFFGGMLRSSPRRGMSDSSASRSDFWSCSDADVRKFWEDGFLIVPELFRPDEAELLHRVSKAEEHGQPDENGVQPIMWLFSTRDAANKEDIFNAVVHSRRMVDTMMRLLGDEVYVYHYKMAMKTKDNPLTKQLEIGDARSHGRSRHWVAPRA